MTLDDFVPTDVPDYTRMGWAVTAKTPTRRLRNAAIVWLNDRWLLTRGLDVRDPSIRAAIEGEILSSFATSSSTTLLGDALEDELVELYADRYGEASGTIRGGSGRCASRGRFNAKGIGPTPLVGPSIDWFHSHGHLWFEEAVHEIVASEMVAFQFPSSAVPVLALISTGADGVSLEGPASAATAIVVRPNFIRLAHLQRSLYFGDAGHPAAPQYIDAERIDQIYSYLERSPQSIIPAASSFDDLLTRSYEANVRQIVFGWLHRLWLGPAFSGNKTIGGAAVDFGPTDVMRSWTRVATGAGDPVMGEERASLTAGYLSVIRTIQSRGLAVGRGVQRQLDFHRLERLAFLDYLQAAVPLRLFYEEHSPEVRRFQNLILACFDAQQQITPLPRTRSGDSAIDDAEQQIASLGSEALPQNLPGRTTNEMRLLHAGLSNLTAPRPGHGRTEVRADVRRQLSATKGRADEIASYLVEKMPRWLAEYRRAWRAKPDELLVERFATDGVAWIADCVDVLSDERRVWIEAPAMGRFACSRTSGIPLADLRGGTVINGQIHAIVSAKYEDASTFLFGPTATSVVF